MGHRRFVVFFFALSLYGQDLTGVLSGTIRDASGGVVPNAEVVVLNAATGVVAWRGKTDAGGAATRPPPCPSDATTSPSSCKASRKRRSRR